MNARAVISAMKTFDGRVSEVGEMERGTAREGGRFKSILSQALQNRIGAVTRKIKDMKDGSYTT